MSKPIRVLIADDHPLFRDGLAGLLTAAPGTDLAGAAADRHRGGRDGPPRPSPMWC